MTLSRSKTGGGYTIAGDPQYGAQPRVVTVIHNDGDYSLVDTLHSRFGHGTVIILRTWHLGDSWDTWGSDPIPAARKWVDESAPIAQHCPWGYLLGPNEPKPNQLREHGIFEAERQRELWRRFGVHAAIGSFGVGGPEINDGQNDPDPQWDLFLDALRECNRLKNILVLHEYGALYVDTFYGPNQDAELRAGKRVPLPEERLEGWLFGRYRKVHRKVLEPNRFFDVRVALGEHGLDIAAGPVTEAMVGRPTNNWQDCAQFWNVPSAEQEYVSQLLWADRQMRKDPYVLGACIFTRGSDERWEGYDILNGVAQMLDSYLNTQQYTEDYRVVNAIPGLFVRIRAFGKVLWAKGVAAYSEIVQVLEVKGEWSHIRRESGFKGWVRSEYLSHV